MRYLSALQAREAALAECLRTRGQLRSAAANATEAYRAHPLPVLGAAVGLGFLIGRLRGGAGVLVTAVRLAGGPAFSLLRRYFGGAG